MAVRGLEPEPGGISEQALSILISLAGGPKHGYAMIHDIAAFSGKRLGPGTLYGAIARLDRAGLIEALPSDDRRTPYRLTPAGARYLQAELESSRRVASLGLRRLVRS